MLFQASEAVLLCGIVDGQALERIQARPNSLRRCAVGLEIAFVTGEEIAPLAGFGVLHRGKYVFQRGQLIAAVDNEGAIRFQGLEIKIRDRAGRHEENDGGD